MAVIFVWHSMASNFNRNPLDEFITHMRGLEHGMDAMPGLIGLYDAWYSVVVPAECALCDC